MVGWGRGGWGTYAAQRGATQARKRRDALLLDERVDDVVAHVGGVARARVRQHAEVPGQQPRQHGADVFQLAAGRGRGEVEDEVEVEVLGDGGFVEAVRRGAAL